MCGRGYRCGGGAGWLITCVSNNVVTLLTSRLIAAEMGRIHCIRAGGGPGEPFVWTKMSHFLTLLQKSLSPEEQRRPGR